jgi:hypothetical protein
MNVHFWGWSRSVHFSSGHPHWQALSVDWANVCYCYYMVVGSSAPRRRNGSNHSRDETIGNRLFRRCVEESSTQHNRDQSHNKREVGYRRITPPMTQRLGRTRSSGGRRSNILQTARCLLYMSAMTCVALIVILSNKVGYESPAMTKFVSASISLLYACGPTYLIRHVLSGE